MHKLISLLVRYRNLLIYQYYRIKAMLSSKAFPTNAEAEFVVSIASYPARAHLLPAVFESLKEQTIAPKRTFLVLTAEEWPNREIPKYLRKLQNEGLHILWVKGNPYSVKMLLPVVEEEPNLGIVTLGDDWIYKKKFIEFTMHSEPAKKNEVSGPLGKVLYRKGNELNMFFRDKNPADKHTPPERIYLMGLGTYYPPNSLNFKALNLEAVKEIVPGRGSDIWFWAASIANDKKTYCIGDYSVRKHTIPIPETRKTAPKDTPGAIEMNRRFNAAIDYFEIREKLINQLPDKSE